MAKNLDVFVRLIVAANDKRLPGYDMFWNIQDMCAQVLVFIQNMKCL